MRIKNPIELGLLIRERRRRLGLSQTELAIRAEVGRQWLVAVEQGKPGVEVGLVLRTLAALGLALSVADAGSGPDMAPADQLPTFDLASIVNAARTNQP